MNYSLSRQHGIRVGSFMLFGINSLIIANSRQPNDDLEK